MGFQGSLDTVGLADIFQLFSFGRKSGALHLTRGHERGVVYFVDGDVYYATAVPTDGIGNLLVRADLVSPEQWKHVLSQSKGDAGHQGEVLLGLDDVDSVALEVFVRERIEDAIFKLVQWAEGDFGLEDEVHPFGPVFRFAVDPLLEVAEQRLQEWRTIEQVVPSVGMGVQVVRDLPDDVFEVTLTRAEWRLLAGVAPGHSIDDIANGLGETEFRVCRVLSGMVERGIVELMSDEKLNALRSLLRADAAGPEGPGAEPQVAHGPSLPEAEAAETARAAVDAADGGGSDAAVGEPPHLQAPAPAASPHRGGEDGADVEPEERKLSIAELAAQAEGGAEDPFATLAAAPDDGAAPHDTGAHEPPATYDGEAAPARYDPAAMLDQQVAVAHTVPTLHYPEPDVGVVAPPPPQPPLHHDFVSAELPVVAEPVARAPEAGQDPAGDAELDKSLILRLIAGVKSL